MRVASEQMGTPGPDTDIVPLNHAALVRFLCSSATTYRKKDIRLYKRIQ